MALIKTGQGVAAISGSIGGTTFARNRYGAYARNRSTVVNPATPSQSAMRLIMATLVQAWSSTLSTAQRAAWDVYGANVAMLNRLGEQVFLPGFNHFIRSNSIRLQAGLSMVLDGPTTFFLGETDTEATIAVTESTQKIALSFNANLAWATEVGGAICLWTGKPQNPTVNFFKGPYKYTGKAAGATPVAPTSPVSLDVPFPIVAAQLIYAQARILRADGRVSEPFRLEIAAVAGA